MIIVTGAAGFIGSNIVADLNAAGRSDIVLVDVLGTQAKWKNIAKRRFQDIVLPSETETLLAKLPGADLVYHMGANSSTTSTDGDGILISNFRSSKHWWEWCSATRTPFIYASSAATYGDGAQGFVDDQSLDALDRLRPLNLYGWSKHAFDKWAVEQSGAGAAPPQWCGLKFFNAYGPNENHKEDMRSLVCKITPTVAAGGSVRLFKSYRPEYADGEQLRDFVYVKDCTKVILWLAGRPEISGIFNLGTGAARSFADLARAVGRALDKPVSVEFIEMPESIRANYQYFTQAHMTKLRHTGYPHEFHGLQEGVADYVRGYLMQPDCHR
ncbi:MAG: ADP-glyceromanno-heptose 6-epimerase [Steroidobacteraceae bacterium]|jgi:ADP-L-glycero-D-manno-heptose 6-epimerase